jgi:hypothetical protein
MSSTSSNQQFQDCVAHLDQAINIFNEIECCEESNKAQLEKAQVLMAWSEALLSEKNYHQAKVKCREFAQTLGQVQYNFNPGTLAGRQLTVPHPFRKRYRSCFIAVNPAPNDYEHFIKRSRRLHIKILCFAILGFLRRERDNIILLLSFVFGIVFIGWLGNLVWLWFSENSDAILIVLRKFTLMLLTILILSLYSFRSFRRSSLTAKKALFLIITLGVGIYFIWNFL